MKTYIVRLRVSANSLEESLKHYRLKEFTKEISTEEEE